MLNGHQFDANGSEKCQLYEIKIFETAQLLAFLIISAFGNCDETYQL